MTAFPKPINSTTHNKFLYVTFRATHNQYSQANNPFFHIQMKKMKKSALYHKKCRILQKTLDTISKKNICILSTKTQLDFGVR